MLRRLPTSAKSLKFKIFNQTHLPKRWWSLVEGYSDESEGRQPFRLGAPIITNPALPATLPSLLSLFTSTASFRDGIRLNPPESPGTLTEGRENSVKGVALSILTKLVGEQPDLYELIEAALITPSVSGRGKTEPSKPREVDVEVYRRRVSGVPEHVRRDIMGHSSQNMTGDYTHATPEAMEDAMERVADYAVNYGRITAKTRKRQGLRLSPAAHKL